MGFWDMFRKEAPIDEPIYLGMIGTRQPYSIIKNEADNSAEVNLYGEVVKERPRDFWTDEPLDEMFIVEKEFIEDIDRLNNFDKVTFRINSVGGNADSGKAIFTKIREMDAETTTIVDGLAASAASIIFMAGDNRQMSVGSQLMIHGASTIVIDYINANKAKDILNMLKKYDDTLTEIYVDRTGNSKESVATMIKNTTWMTASEAVEKGFADDIVNASEPVAAKVIGADDMIVVNGNPLRLSPEMMPAMKYGKTVSLDKIFCDKGSLNINNNNLKKEVEIMNLEQLKTQYPDLVDAIVKETTEAVLIEKEKTVEDAVKAERERIKGIEEIQNRIADKELINKAKFDTTMDAKELAFEAMKAEADVGAQALNAMDSDSKASGVGEVMADPIAGTESESKMQDVAEGAALITAALNN